LCDEPNFLLSVFSSAVKKLVKTAGVDDIRAEVPPYLEDRFFSPDIEAAKSIIKSGKLSSHLPFNLLA